MPYSTPPGPSYDGNSSSFGSITALGGGNGGGYPRPNNVYRQGRPGGSGGGSAGNPTDSPPDRGGASPPGGSGASGQGILADMAHVSGPIVQVISNSWGGGRRRRWRFWW